ncbi:MAG: hypothetical protein ACP5Q3_10695 [bacterium]
MIAEMGPLACLVKGSENISDCWKNWIDSAKPRWKVRKCDHKDESDTITAVLADQIFLSRKIKVFGNFKDGVIIDYKKWIVQTCLCIDHPSFCQIQPNSSFTNIAK